jgi:hypothetical protein
MARDSSAHSGFGPAWIGAAARRARLRARPGSYRNADPGQLRSVRVLLDCPPTMAEGGGTRFRIDATGQDREGRDIQGGANESNVEFTLAR